MRFSRFFIDRPIFAAVIAISITVFGALAYFTLPISQYPDIVPPTVTVSAQYPGATAETVADTIAAPIEQQINGVDGMLYQSSQSTGDGKVTITVTFKVGTDLNQAQILVQNRVAIALPRLPPETQALGVTTTKTSPDFLFVVTFQSPDGSLSPDYISNYALTHVKDPIARIYGVGSNELFGSRDYAMRIWIDPGRAATLDLTADEIVAALRAQNVQVNGGALGAPPLHGNGAFQVSVEALGRLSDPKQFSDIVIRTDKDGNQVRISDVARVELGAADYGTNAWLNGMPGVQMAVKQLPGSNALATATAVTREMEVLSKRFPKGLEYKIAYNPTAFISQSITAVAHTLAEAIFLVVLVVIVFLRSWRAAIVPILAIPVSLIGSFSVLAAIGYSLNMLSLFGMVLAIGIVVDDAIVVVENIERNMEKGMSPIEAARLSMDEVAAALVAIVLVLCAVFLPTLILSGLSGAFYRQFAVTIASATVISLILSLTLSPAVGALLLRPKSKQSVNSYGRVRKAIDHAGDRFESLFEALGARYARLTRILVQRPKQMMAGYLLLIGATAIFFWMTPVGFIPPQDQGYFVALVQLPAGSSIERTDAVMQDLAKRVLPIKGIGDALMLSGFDFPTFTAAPNAGAMPVPLKSFEERERLGVTFPQIMAEAQKAIANIQGARVILVPPPIVQGIGSAGGYSLMIEDRESRGYSALAKISNDLIAKANQTEGLAQVFTFFDISSPRVVVDIDRPKAAMLGVPPERVFSTLQTYLGSTFVNDFNLLGRTFHVTAQADSPFREAVADIANLKTRSDSGAMVPIGAVATFHDKIGPYRVVRYNLNPAVEIDGDTAPGYASGQSLDTVETLADGVLPPGYDHEWTTIAYQQREAGNTSGIVFAMATLFVFLVLAAQYESLTLPLAIILIVPMCLLAAMAGVNFRGMDNNVLTQIGFIVLIALAAKNAILVVEFAKQAEDQNGMSPVEAAEHAARTRLRPILMTSFAFILGSVPLVIAQGAGAELRQALGTAVFFGMVGVTGFGLLFTPTFYVVCRNLSIRLSGQRTPAPAHNPILGTAE
jgi:hydrophobe/amphiphile efflux-1 (HAE1) family protein